MGAKSGEGRRRVVEIYRKAGREERGEEVERRIRNGSKEKEVCFWCGAFAKSSTENFPWFSVDLCPRLGSQDR